MPLHADYFTLIIAFLRRCYGYIIAADACLFTPASPLTLLLLHAAPCRRHAALLRCRLYAIRAMLLLDTPCYAIDAERYCRRRLRLLTP